MNCWNYADVEFADWAVQYFYQRSDNPLSLIELVGLCNGLSKNLEDPKWLMSTKSDGILEDLLNDFKEVGCVGINAHWLKDYHNMSPFDTRVSIAYGMHQLALTKNHKLLSESLQEVVAAEIALAESYEK